MPVADPRTCAAPPAPRVLLLAALALLAGCHKPAADPPVRIEISHLAGSQALQLGQSFHTSSNQDICIDKLRYYLSNWRLRRRDGSWFTNPQSPQSADGYFLVDESLPASKHFAVGPAPAGDYSGIEFLIGVDAARNHAGAQNGALDPARGMFWTWRAGYVFLKIEGQSPQSSARDQVLSYHVGGDDAGATLARTVFLPLPEPVHVRPQLQSEIHLDCDVSALFSAGQGLRVADLSETMAPPGAAAVADGFAAAFRVDHVHNLPRRAGPDTP